MKDCKKHLKAKKMHILLISISAFKNVSDTFTSCLHSCVVVLAISSPLHTCSSLKSQVRSSFSVYPPIFTYIHQFTHRFYKSDIYLFILFNLNSKEQLSFRYSVLTKLIWDPLCCKNIFWPLIISLLGKRKSSKCRLINSVWCTWMNVMYISQAVRYFY